MPLCLNQTTTNIIQLARLSVIMVSKTDGEM